MRDTYGTESQKTSLQSEDLTKSKKKRKKNNGDHISTHDDTQKESNESSGTHYCNDYKNIPIWLY